MRILIVLMILAGVGKVGANTFYMGNNCESWHLYCERAPELEEKEEEKPAVKPEPEEVEPEEKRVVESVIKVEGPKVGSAAWLKVKLPEYLENAIDNPTDKNIKAWAFAHKLSMDKAEKFSRAAERIMQTNPMLDETNRKPTFQRANYFEGARIRKARKDAFEELIGSKPIIFAFKEGCTLCGEMAVTLKAIEKEYGASVLAISKDGKPLSNGMFSDYKTDKGQLDKLNVFSYPATLFYDPNTKRWVPIVYNAMHKITFMKRALMVGVNEGWISEQDYLQTRSLAHYLLTDINPDELDTEKDEKDAFIDGLNFEELE